MGELGNCYYIVLEQFFARLPEYVHSELPGLCWNYGSHENNNEYITAWINRSQALFDDYTTCIKYAEKSHGAYRIYRVYGGNLMSMIYEQPTRLQKALGE